MMDMHILPTRFLHDLLSDPASWSGLSTALLQCLPALMIVAGLMTLLFHLLFDFGSVGTARNELREVTA